MTLERDPIPSPNYSSRAGAAVRLIVLHTAEGATTYQSLGSFFANPASGVSSHVGIDDTPGRVGVYVRRGDKAWCQGDANPHAVCAELCAFAAWSLEEWHAHPVMLQSAAAWVAEEAAAFGIPLRALTPGEAQGGAAGVCQHVDLGAAGGNHWDCGPGFPMGEVLAMAAGGAAPAGAEERSSGMVLWDQITGGYWIAWPDGAVHTARGAPYLGGCNNDRVNPGHYPCVGIAERDGADGYVLVLDWAEADEGDRARLYDFPRNGSAII